MSTKTTDQEIRTRIDSFLTELSGLVKKAALEAVQEALAGGSAPKRRGPGRPRGSSKRGPGRPRKTGRPARAGKRAKRSSEDVEAMAARVLAQVRSKQGQRLEQIGKAMKVPTKGLKLPIQKLLASKRVKTKRQKRGTRYFVR